MTRRRLTRRRSALNPEPNMMKFLGEEKGRSLAPVTRKTLVPVLLRKKKKKSRITVLHSDKKHL